MKKKVMKDPIEKITKIVKKKHEEVIHIQRDAEQITLKSY